MSLKKCPPFFLFLFFQVFLFAQNEPAGAESTSRNSGQALSARFAGSKALLCGLID